MVYISYVYIYIHIIYIYIYCTYLYIYILYICIYMYTYIIYIYINYMWYLNQSYPSKYQQILHTCTSTVRKKFSTMAASDFWSLLPSEAASNWATLASLVSSRRTSPFCRACVAGRVGIDKLGIGGVIRMLRRRRICAMLLGKVDCWSSGDYSYWRFVTK